MQNYGAPEDPDRNFVLLTGLFADQEGDACHIPVIKYIFRK